MRALKRWEKKLSRAWEQVGRGKKTLLYLILCGLFSLGIWVRLGCPLPTVEMELRRWERTHLLEPGQIVFAGREDEALTLEDQLTVYLTRGLLASVGERWAVIGEDKTFRKVALEESPTAAAAWTSTLVNFSEAGPKFCVPVMVFGVPEGAASGEMMLETGSEAPLAGSGGQVAEVVWLFALGTEADQWSLHAGAPCTLRLRRADGSLLLEQEGVLH